MKNSILIILLVLIALELGYLIRQSKKERKTLEDMYKNLWFIKQESFVNPQVLSQPTINEIQQQIPQITTPEVSVEDFFKSRLTENNDGNIKQLQ